MSTPKKCSLDGQEFLIEDEEIAFYKKMEVGEPSLCPHCREQRRLIFRNERHLYHGKCDLCGKEMISMYSAESPYTVYCQNCWWSDKWNAETYGKDFDFSRPFFDQFDELMKSVPRICLMNKEAENSEYCNFAWRNKNCYLMFTSAENEDSYYSKRCWRMKNICDCSHLVSCELCYECIDSSKCYNCSFLQNSSDCNNCIIGYNLKGCHDCFACFNLVKKSYCIYNKQYTKEEYERKVVGLKKNINREFETFSSNKSIVRKCMDLINTEDSSGNALINSKNAKHCFDSSDLQDCKYIFDASMVKDCMDINNDDHSELSYEGGGGESSYMVRFFDICWWNKFITYCSLCFNSQNLFGCVGVRKGEFSILNKQYSKEEYEKLAARVIEHMKSTGEWGLFFPMKISPFAYNESLAQDYYPLNKDRVQSMGLKWKDEDQISSYQGPKVEIPANIADVGDEITKQILTCEVSGKLYKITAQELEFYRQMGLPIPKKCPDQRYLERMHRKNPRKLWDRKCGQCGVDIQSVYSTDRPEKILCEGCYLKEIY